MGSPTRVAAAPSGRTRRRCGPVAVHAPFSFPGPAQRGGVEFSEIRDLGELQLLSGRYTDHVFAPHFHCCYSIGVVLDGGMRYRHCGHDGIARPGSIFLINPGEVHTAEGIDGTGWGFRSFYLGERRLESVAAELFGTAVAPPTLKGPFVHNDELALQLIGVHNVLETSPELLEQESWEVSTLALLLARYGMQRRLPIGVKCEREAVRGARAIIEDRYAENVSLSEIAHEIGLSRYHFLRVFQNEVGLTPHRYLTQVRIERARERLRSGSSIVQTALACGFSDQAHLTRQFKRILGFTPGRFREACRGTRPLARASNVSDWLVRARTLKEAP